MKPVVRERLARTWGWRLAPWLLTMFPALPLWMSIAQESGSGGGARRGHRARDDDGEERVEGSGPAQSRFRGPTIPASALIADEERERCEPFLVPIPSSGNAWLGCVEYEVGVGDRVALRRLLLDGKTGPARFANAQHAAIVRPVAALDAKGRLNVVWTEVQGGRPRLVLAREESGAAGFSAPIVLTAGGETNRNAEIARASDGSLWLAWERWRPRSPLGGSIDVMLAELGEKGLGEPVLVSHGPGSDVDPVVAAAADGRLGVAWSRYSGLDYEIVLKTFDVGKRLLGAEVNVSADALADDVHPAIAAATDGAFWIAWDRLEDAARGRSTPADLRAELRLDTMELMERSAPPQCSVRVACVDRSQQVWWPKSRDLDGASVGDGVVAGAPLHSFSGGTPRLVATSDGRVNVLFRFLARQGPGGRAYGFPLLASTIDGEGIGPPVMVADSAGAPEEPAACASADASANASPGGVLIAWQQDHRLECETGTLLRPIPKAHFQKLAPQNVVITGSLAPSGIGVAHFEPRAGTKAAATTARTGRLLPAHFHPSGEDLEDPFVNGADHFVIARGDGPDTTKYRVYWGDLHRHSSVSRCTRGFEPNPTDRWSFGRDVSLYDFMALTDHSCHVDALGWWRLDKVCEIAGSPGFVALAGFEWSTGFHGHQNVILSGELRPFLSNSHAQLATPEGLYAGLAAANVRALAIPHHPADVARRVDFGRCNPALVRLVEIYQAQRGSYEFDGCFKQSRLAHAAGSFATDALKRGLKVGFVASTDHGEGASYACALAESLDREHVFEALHARRTYGATIKGMLVDLRVDGRLMGEELTLSGSAPAPRVTLKARGTRPLAEVVVFRNGEAWRTLGRAPARSDGRTELTIELQFEQAPASAPRPSDWDFVVKAGEGVALRPWFELPGYARDDLGPDRPEWRVKDGAATYSWKKTYAGFWEPSHSRLRISGLRSATIEVGSTSVSLATLAAFDESGGKSIRGDSPVGPWRLAASESFDAAVDLSRDLGVKELTTEWVDDALPEGTNWYYVRVIQSDGELAWSSPIWVTRNP